MAESADITAPEVRWSDGALKRMERAPLFLRGMVRRLAEGAGLGSNGTVITSSSTSLSIAMAWFPHMAASRTRSPPIQLSER